MDEGELADRECGVHHEATMRHLIQSLRGRPSTQFCIDCGELIPKERRDLMKKNKMTCDRCVACKTAAERLGG